MFNNKFHFYVVKFTKASHVSMQSNCNVASSMPTLGISRSCVLGKNTES